MDRYYRERFHIQRDLIQAIAPLIEVKDIIERVRHELRVLIPNAMEVCILLLDPDAEQYTSPLQCALYERAVDCQSCKRDRPAVKKAIEQKKAVVISQSQPIRRRDNSQVPVGPEYAMPVFVGTDILAVVSVVIQPLCRYRRKDFFIIRDFTDLLGTIIMNAKRHWEMTQEKLRISRMLTHLSPFVPQSVRDMVDQDPNLLTREKEKKEISVLFLDLEGYTQLSASRPEAEVNQVIERMFSSFVDPIHRFSGEINETAGDGLMILFKNHDPETNAVNAVRAAFEIMERNQTINRAITQSRVRAMEPIRVNIGINSGPALVGMTRFKGALSTRMTYTATGSVTNIAARLSDKAQNGDILIGQPTRDLIKKIWPVRDLGQMSLKGLSSPLPVFSLLQTN